MRLSFGRKVTQMQGEWWVPTDIADSGVDMAGRILSKKEQKNRHVKY
jgi:hypothetical protein